MINLNIISIKNNLYYIYYSEMYVKFCTIIFLRIIYNIADKNEMSVQGKY